MHVGYIRVSTDDQNLSLQKDEITKKAKQSSLSVSKYVMLKVFGIN